MPTTNPIALGAIAEGLDASLGPTTDRGSWLVRVVSGLDDAIVGLMPLDDVADHPVDALVGFRADASWLAAGVISHGRARDLETADVDSIRVVYLIDRQGRESSVLRRLDGSEPFHPAGPSQGRMSDCCRRMLGMATAPPELAPEYWYAALWVEAALGVAAAEPAREWTWPALAHLHPLVAADLPPAMPRVLAAQVRDECDRAGGWPAIRAAAMLGDAPWVPVDAELAEWMDLGMFSRWCVASVADPAELLADVAGLLPRRCVDWLVQAFVGWGIG